MTKILFIGGNLSQNEGGTALVITAYKALKKSFPNLKASLLSFRYESDLKRKSQYPYIITVPENINIKISVLFYWIYRLLLVSIWKIILKIFLINFEKLINENVLKEYNKSDYIIEISGDGLSGDYGFYSTFISLSRLLIGILMKKFVIIYAQSVGPFNIKWPNSKKQSWILSKIIKIYAKLVLNRVSLITAREEITLDYLEDMQIKNPPIYLTADSAFLLSPIPKESVECLLLSYGICKNDKIIGISISNSISELQYESESGISSEDFKNLMVELLDIITEKYNLKAILIPHVTGPGVINDDRVIAQKIYDMCLNKDRTTLILEEFGPEELKGIIGRCDIFIGSRMHANIAALSMQVPTIAIGYSHKTNGIMNMMKQNNLIIDYENLSIERLISKIEYCIKNKDNISNDLFIYTKKIQEKSLQNASLVKNLNPS